MQPIEIYFSFTLLFSFSLSLIICLTQKSPKRDRWLLSLALLGLTIGTVFRTFTLLILDELSILILLIAYSNSWKLRLRKLAILPCLLITLNIALSAALSDVRVVRFFLVLLSVLALFALTKYDKINYLEVLVKLWWASLIAIILYSAAGYCAVIILGSNVGHFLISGSGVDEFGTQYIAITQGSAYAAIAYISLLSSDLLMRIYKNEIDWHTPASVAVVSFVAYQYDSRSGYFVVALFVIAQLFLLAIRSSFIAGTNFKVLAALSILLLVILTIVNFEEFSYFLETQFLDIMTQGSGGRDSNRLLHFLAYKEYVTSEPIQALMGAGIYSHKNILADFINSTLLSQLDKSHYLPGMGLDSAPVAVRTNFIIAALVDLGILPSLLLITTFAACIVRYFSWKLSAMSSYYIFLLPSLSIVALSSNISDALLAVVLLILPLSSDNNNLHLSPRRKFER